MKGQSKIENRETRRKRKSKNLHFINSIKTVLIKQKLGNNFNQGV